MKVISIELYNILKDEGYARYWESDYEGDIPEFVNNYVNKVIGTNDWVLEG